MRYDAFISYRHSELDMYIAKKVHKGLETFKVPRAVQKKSGKKNIKRVFRDQEELPIGSDLGNNIESALAESEFLLVICSPRTPESYWVQKEIDTFIRMHDREHVLAILIEGEPEQSFPQQLLMDEQGNSVEPLAADVRGMTKSEMNKKLKTELMRLAAPLLSCSYDDLRQRHKERRMKKFMAAATVVAGVAVAFGAYSAYNSAMIQQNYEEKQRNQSRYLADTAISLLEASDRKTAVLVALEALPSAENERPHVARAQYALSEALRCYDTGNVLGNDISLKHEFPVSDFSYNADGSQIISIDSGKNVYVWSVADGELLAKVAPEIKNGYPVAPEEAMVAEGHLWICDGDILRSLKYDGTEEWRIDMDCIYCEIDVELGVAVCVSNDEVHFIDIWTGKSLGYIEEQTGNSFTSKVVFCVEEKKVAISHLSNGPDVINGVVTVYDFETKTAVDYKTQNPYITEMTFTTDGNLVVVDFEDFDYSNLDVDDAFAGCIEKIDLASQTQLWMHETTLQLFGDEAGEVVVISRAYTDETTGILHDEVLLAVDNRLSTLDSVTGEIVMETMLQSGITSFQVSTENAFGFVTEGDGCVNIMNMTTGYNYSSSAVDVGRSVLDVQIRQGTLASRGYSSPEITLMKYHEGAGIEQLNTYQNTVMDVLCSPNEEYYAVKIYESNKTESHYFFYRMADDEPVGEFGAETETDRGYEAAAGYLDDRYFVYISTKGVITYCDMETGEMTDLPVVEEDYYGDGTLNYNGTMAFLYDSNQVYIVNLLDKTVVFQGEIGSYVRGGIVSEDGNVAFCSTKEDGEQLYRIDLTSGVTEKIEASEYGNISLYETSSALAVSPDNTLLAVGCVDNYIRVWDTQEKKTIAEIPFANIYHHFIRFSEDGTKLMMQGDDQYFRVYDLTEQEFVHVSSEQYNKIQRLSENSDMQNISLVTNGDVTILNEEDYELMTYVSNGLEYMSKWSKVYVCYYDNLYRFPYMTLPALLEEARKQFGDAQLTVQERTQYHVE